MVCDYIFPSSLQVFYLLFLLLLTLPLQYDHRPPDKKLQEEPIHYDNIPDNQPGKPKPLVSPNLIGFNETQYLLASHKNSDSYKLNAFNQMESDKLASDRPVPDTRNYKLVWPKYICMCAENRGMLFVLSVHLLLSPLYLQVCLQDLP